VEYEIFSRSGQIVGSHETIESSLGGSMSIRKALLVICSFFSLSFSASEGISYYSYTTDVPQSVHVMVVDPSKRPILPAKALDKSVGREDVLSLATRKGALAAVNGGFFAIGKYDGTPSGILKINNVWYGLPTKPRGALGWSNGGKKTVFDRVLTKQVGIEFSVVSQTGATTSDQWDKVEHIVGGTPLLVRDGEVVDDFSPEQTLYSFLWMRHARTAVGVLPNGHWVFVIVDGKQPYFSKGMTIDELAHFMQELGCVYALNLDGGGSTTFVYKNEIINRPYGDGDNNESGKPTLRAVSDAILILDN